MIIPDQFEIADSYTLDAIFSATVAAFTDEEWKARPVEMFESALEYATRRGDESGVANASEFLKLLLADS